MSDEGQDSNQFGKGMSNEAYAAFLGDLNRAPEDSPGFHGSSDHASSRDQTPKPKKETPMDPEAARIAAQGLAGMVGEISELLKGHIDRENAPHGVVYKKIGLGFIGHDSLETIYGTGGGAVEGIGTGHITFREFHNRLQDEKAKGFGIDTSRVLEISIHTDSATSENANELTPGTFDFNIQRTLFYFTGQGEFGKLSTIPINFNDPRPDINGDTNINADRKLIRSEMTPPDFELAGMALRKIIDQLSQPADQAQPAA